MSNIFEICEIKSCLVGSCRGVIEATREDVELHEAPTGLLGIPRAAGPALPRLHRQEARQPPGLVPAEALAPPHPGVGELVCPAGVAAAGGGVGQPIPQAKHTVVHLLREDAPGPGEVDDTLAGPGLGEAGGRGPGVVAHAGLGVEDETLRAGDQVVQAMGALAEGGGAGTLGEQAVTIALHSRAGLPGKAAGGKGKNKGNLHHVLALLQ